MGIASSDQRLPGAFDTAVALDLSPAVPAVDRPSAAPALIPGERFKGKLATARPWALLGRTDLLTARAHRDYRRSLADDYRCLGLTLQPPHFLGEFQKEFPVLRRSIEGLFDEVVG